MLQDKHAATKIDELKARTNLANERLIRAKAQSENNQKTLNDIKAKAKEDFNVETVDELRTLAVQLTKKRNEELANHLEKLTVLENALNQMDLKLREIDEHYK